MSIGFLTQYYRGLGHSQRIKFIAEKTAETHDVVVMDQLFDPPIEHKVPHIAFLRDYKVSNFDNIFQFIQSDSIINLRIKQFIETIEKYKVKILVCEGFPFCRQQFAHEYFRYLEECRKRNIKIIISVRDFPWDEPHSGQLTDWVVYTQNIVCKYFADYILVHGDEKLLPLISDRTKHAHSKQIIKDIKHLLKYTGYVCDETQPKHSRKNNNIYISTGLNKNEAVTIFKHVAALASEYPDYKFIMPFANRYKSLGNRKNKNIYLVEYIPELRSKLADCAAYITYGGYNATVEILKGEIPSIIIPRQDGKKLEQFVRAFTFEPYDFHKVLTVQEVGSIKEVLDEVLAGYKPKSFEDQFNLNGTTNTAKFLGTMYDKLNT